jgi:hypothetical protein
MVMQSPFHSRMSVARVPGITLAVALFSCVVAAPLDARQSCSPVMEWNQYALQATVTAGQGALPQIRSLAIVHASVHDALNAVLPTYETYLPVNPAPGDASADAAVIAAAHHALRKLFPSQAADLDQKRSTSLGSCGVADTNSGVGTGVTAAEAIFTLRSTDGAAQAGGPYTPPPDAGMPGVWEPGGPAPVVAPGWGKVRPWVMRSGSQFRPEAPPALGSDTYTRDYDEVKALGAKTNSSRTWEQTQIAIFWDGSPSAIWNSVARGVIAARGLNSVDAARTLALMYVAAADASIACFDAKYTYNFWRPISAIHRADEDGNARTVPDTAWEPLITTHQHPEYPSGHSTNSSAMATTLKLLFGDDPGVPIVATSPRNPSFPRNWTTFSEGVKEVISARVYIGFHFRNSDKAGARVGRQVAKYVYTHALRD